MTLAPSVSVVIVAWNGCALLGRCLGYLFAQQSPPSFEVIVVDNGSSDGTPEMVEARFPQCQLIRSGENLGFAAGNNLGFAHARGRHVLLLNPDVYLTEPLTLQRLSAFLDETPRFAGVGCRLTYADGRHQVGDAGYRPTPRALLMHGLGISRLLPGVRGLFLTRLAPQGAMEVDWLSGALFLVRREVIDAVDGLDTSFFLYAEDVEWGCRMRRAGWYLAYLPDLSAIHLQGGTQGEGAALGATPSLRWIDALAHLYAREHANGFWAFRLGLGVGFGLRAMVFALAGLLRAGWRPRARAMATFSRHILTMPAPR